MNFEIRQHGNRYSVYLDDKEVWCNDYQQETTPKEIFIDFIDAVNSDDEVVAGEIVKVLMEREL